MDVRHKIEESIESHGGKVIEKMPNAVGRKSCSLNFENEFDFK